MPYKESSNPNLVEKQVVRFDFMDNSARIEFSHIIIMNLLWHIDELQVRHSFPSNML